MDISCIILTCLLLLQMIVVLIMLNPIYDVQKMTKYIHHITKTYKRMYHTAIMAYFSFVIYLGMYIPLQNIQYIIFNNHLNEYDKLILLNRVEKNYIIAGFSLFMVIVMYSVRALISFTANLIEISKRSETLMLQSKSKDNVKLITNEGILPNLLRVKRSISYETILYGTELKDQLKTMMVKNMDLPRNQCMLSSILETTNSNVL